MLASTGSNVPVTPQPSTSTQSVANPCQSAELLRNMAVLLTWCTPPELDTVCSSRPLACHVESQPCSVSLGLQQASRPACVHLYASTSVWAQPQVLTEQHPCNTRWLFSQRRASTAAATLSQPGCCKTSLWAGCMAAFYIVGCSSLSWVGVRAQVDQEFGLFLSAQVRPCTGEHCTKAHTHICRRPSAA